MDSTADCGGSNRSSNLRRYTPVQSRIQWPKGRMISDGQPQLECGVPRELAYQAQIAACNYLGYSTREFSTAQFRQQAISADPCRPLELHMHHHHHHYLASPTSPFSQTSSAPFFGEPELAATAAALSIRVGSRHSPAITARSACCPILGCPVATPVPDIHLPDFVQNSSQGPRRSYGYSESNQRSTQNVLCLKNQPSEVRVEKSPYIFGQEVSNVLEEGGLVKRDSGSPLSNNSDIRSIEYPNKLSWSKDYDSEQQQRSKRELTGGCRQAIAPLRKSDMSSFGLAKNQKDAERGSPESPWGSLSDETSATKETATPTVHEPHPTSLSTFRTMIDPWKPKCIHGRTEDEELARKPSTPETHGSQAAEKPVYIRHSSQPHTNGAEVKHVEVSGSSICEDVTTSAGKDSFSGSENVSGLLCNWACVGPPKGKSQKREYRPPPRPARKNFGARASRRHASKEARGWDCKERKTFEGVCHPEARDDEMKRHPCISELESQTEVGKTADVNRCDYEHEGNLPHSDSGKEVFYRRDESKFKVQKVGDQPSPPCHPEAGKTRKHANNVTLLDSATVERDGIVEDILNRDDRRGTEKLKSDYLQDPVWSTSFCTPWTNDFKSNKSTSQNRFREAVEAAWKTSLGTKSEPESDDLNCERISDVGGDSQVSPQAKLTAQIIARVTPEHKFSAADDTEKVAEESIRDLLDGRAIFRAKFKEELEQGVTDRLRLQELLQLEKFKLEATERELREVKRGFQEALLSGAKANKKHTSKLRLENQLVNTLTTSGVVEERGDTQIMLKSESDARIAAEAKASYFEASAKAAEEKVQNLLKERNWFYSRFKEPNNTDKTASNQSMEQDNIHHERSESSQRKKLDARGHVASSVLNEPSHRVTEDAERDAQNGTHGTTSYPPRLKQELELDGADRCRLHRLQEPEEPRRGLVKETQARSSMVPASVASLNHEGSPVFPTEKGLQREHQRDHSSSLAATSENAKQLAAVCCGNSYPKNEKKRTHSPTSSSRAQKWTPNLPFTVKIERCRLEDGKTTTTFDISPNFEPRGYSPDQNDCKLELRNNEDAPSTTCTDNSSDFVVEVADDEELVSRKVSSFSYNISGQQDEHLDAKGEELEGIKCQEAERLSDQDSVNRGDKQSESDKSKKQSDLGAESTGSSMCSEEPDVYNHNESDGPERHTNGSAERTPRFELHDNDFDAQRQHSPGRHGKHVERDQGNPVRKMVEGFDDRLMLLPSRWKRAAKAELRRIIQEQELTWKIAEDAVDELTRRLELLEKYKMEIQDNLSRCHVRNDRDRFWTRLDQRFEDSPRGFSSSYHSPIFENRLGSTERETAGRTSRQADSSVAMLHEWHQPNDLEIQKLKADIADLKSQLCGRRSSRASSPMKDNFQYSSSSSPPTPPLPPPPATPATPPTPPTVPDYQHHAFQQFANGSQVPLVRGSELVRIGPEVVVGVLKAEEVEAQAEKVKIVTSQATRNGRNGYSSKKAESHQNHEDPLSEESLSENRSWVPIPDDESMERNCWVRSDLHDHGDRDPCETGQNFAVVRSSRILNPNRPASGNDDNMTRKLNAGEEVEVEVFEDALRKISNIFSEQEGKFKRFTGAVNMAEAGPTQYFELRSFYVNLLNEMSEQLGELCRDLQGDSSESLVQNVHNRDTMVSPPAGGSEVEKLRTALEAARRQIKEEVNINCLLRERLDAGDKHLSKILEEHAEELMTKEKTVSLAQQLNLQLANEMSVTESSLVELRSRYKSLVANLESQLKEAREEVTNLQCTLSDLKLEVERNQGLVIDLERAGREKELQIQHLTERVQAYGTATERNQSLVVDLERAGQDKELQIQGLTEQVQAYQTETHRIQSLVIELQRAGQEKELQIQELSERVQAYKTETQRNQCLVIDLERAGQEKELQIQELSEQVQAYQSETHQMSVEKFELLKNIQELRREADNQQRRVAELVDINEDLIDFAQSKEDEMKALTKEVTSLQQVSKGKSDEADKLAIEAAISLRELIEARRDGESYLARCENLKSKLEETEQELMAREDALERLTRHLSSTIEGQDLISEEKEQLQLSLSKAQYKEGRTDDQIRQSKVIIKDLEEKQGCMEEELTKARIVMTDMRVKDQETLAIKKEAGEMRCRIHELEEEIMEKEGQISILRSSYPGLLAEGTKQTGMKSNMFKERTENCQNFPVSRRTSFLEAGRHLKQKLTD